MDTDTGSFDSTTPDPEEYDGYSVDDETQLDPADTLDDADVEDELDRGYSPPERYSPAQDYGNTPWEAAHPQPLDERLAQEVPDESADDDLDADDDGLPHDADEDSGEVGDRRAGRLVDPDLGGGDDLEKDLVGEDVGIDGAAASAEEAAMHIIDEP